MADCADEGRRRPCLPLPQTASSGFVITLVLTYVIIAGFSLDDVDCRSVFGGELSQGFFELERGEFADGVDGSCGGGGQAAKVFLFEVAIAAAETVKQ
ncbi:MAG: hypothetical protein ACI92S_003202, partial [Planctomycetaceae bacterium]